MKTFKYILKRLGLMLLTLFIIMTAIFVLVRLLPNQIPTGLGDSAAATRAMHEAWGYNKPIMVQYGIFLKNVFTKWDWGFCTTVGRFLSPVTEFVATKFPPTVYINVITLIVSLPIGILLGILAAVKKNTWIDHFISTIVMLFISVPSYVYAFVIQYWLGFKFGWFPLVVDSGYDYFSWSYFYSMILPILAMGFGMVAGYTRFVRAELTETLTSEYMLLARAKGLTRRQATIHHALRNAFVPILPSILAEFISLLGGSLIIEKIFAIPGVGYIFVAAINLLDYSVFMYVAMFYTAIGLVGGIITDLSYSFIDPRIRMGGGKTNEL